MCRIIFLLENILYKTFACCFYKSSLFKVKHYILVLSKNSLKLFIIFTFAFGLCTNVTFWEDIFIRNTFCSFDWVFPFFGKNETWYHYFNKKIMESISLLHQNHILKSLFMENFYIKIYFVIVNILPKFCPKYDSLTLLLQKDLQLIVKVTFC